jgi:hypothetical protein
MLQQAFTELKGLECQLSDSRQRENDMRTCIVQLTNDLEQCKGRALLEQVGYCGLCFCYSQNVLTHT